MTDSLNRIVEYEWCRCGDLRKITDMLGRVTRWEYDVQQRARANRHPRHVDRQEEPSQARLAEARITRELLGSCPRSAARLAIRGS